MLVLNVFVNLKLRRWGEPLHLKGVIFLINDVWASQQRNKD